MNAVIYARYSSDSQREESIEGQLRESLAFAESKGLTVVHSYIDRALSAKTDNRPEFKQMIKDSSKGKFGIVIVWKLDRFSRNRYDSAHYKTLLKKNGVKVVSATETIADDASGILLESMLEGFAEYYSADLSEKVTRGLTENALKCKYNGSGYPVGYKVNSEQMYELDPVTAPIVQEVFKKYRDGTSIKRIVEYLAGIGVKNYRGYSLSIDAVKLMLKNRRYLGEYIYGEIVIPGGMPRIIDDDLFNKVQVRMEKNRKAPARTKAKKDMYLLTTKLFCGKCGAYMVGESGTSRNGKFHQYYKCANVKNHKGCDKKTVRKADIEDFIIHETIKTIMDDDFLDKIVDQVYTFQLKESTAIPQLKRQIAETTKAIDNMIKAIEQGIITASTKERLEKLEHTKQELEISLANEEILKPVLSKEHIKFWLCQFRSLNMADESDRQLLIDNFVNAIYLYDDKVVFTFNYRTDAKTVSMEDIKCSDLAESRAPPYTVNKAVVVKKQRCKS